MDKGYLKEGNQLRDRFTLFQAEGELSEDKLEIVSGSAVAFALKHLLEKQKNEVSFRTTTRQFRDVAFRWNW